MGFKIAYLEKTEVIIGVYASFHTHSTRISIRFKIPESARLDTDSEKSIMTFEGNKWEGTPIYTDGSITIFEVSEDIPYYSGITNVNDASDFFRKIVPLCLDYRRGYKARHCQNILTVLVAAQNKIDRHRKNVLEVHMATHQRLGKQAAIGTLDLYTLKIITDELKELTEEENMRINPMGCLFADLVV